MTRQGGTDEIHLHVPDGSSRDTAHRPLGIRVVTQSGRKVVRDVQIGTLPDGEGPGYLCAEIAAVDHEAQTIAIPDQPGFSKGFAAGRMVRIHNAHRTAMFRVVRTVRKNGHLHLTLDRTALMAQGPVVEVGEGTLTLDAHLTFANGRLEPDGTLRDHMLEYKGARLEGWLVKGAIRGEKSQVRLMEPVPAKTLRQTCGGRIISITHYGVGDSVEVAGIAAKA